MIRQRQYRKDGGFTLIELLLAMFILVILVLLTSRVFHSASQTWSAGLRKAEVNLVGRSVMDYMDREISRAIFATNHYRVGRPVVSGSTITFSVLGESQVPDGRVGGGTSLVERISISLIGNRIQRSSGTNTQTIISNMEELSFEMDDPDWPTYVDIRLGFKVSDDRHRDASVLVNNFTKRVYFRNFTRNYFDETY